MRADRRLGRLKRHRSLRKRVVGMPQRPRLAVFRSHKHLVAQIINDFENKTLLGCSTKSEALGTHAKGGGNIAAAQKLGKVLAAEAIKHGVKRVVFDRGGYRYHGRIKALAEAAREGGLEF